MSTATWITMIAVLGFVWGGFAVILTTAVRKEGAKRGAPPGDRAGDHAGDRPGERPGA